SGRQPDPCIESLHKSVLQYSEGALMTQLTRAIAITLLSAPIFAALPVVPGKDQASMLKSSDKKLAANKKICYDFYRIELRGAHAEKAAKSMRTDYIQHNPTADTGIAGFKAFFSRLGGPTTVPETLADLV